MNDADRIGFAWFCWGIPALFGVFVTAMHAATGEGFLVVLGLLCIPFGTLLFLVGVGMLVLAKSGPRRLVLGLLLSNFPLAYLCALIGFHSMSAFGAEVYIFNKSDHPFEEVAVVYNEVIAHRYGKVHPGNMMRIKVSIGSGGRDDMTLTLTHNGRELTLVLGNYDADDLIGGQTIRVEVTNDGVRRVKD
jgi:hypothetical protein